MTPVRSLALLIALGLASPVLAQTAAPAATVAADDLPAGAPRDDYEFVGWCAGALTGHMALYEQVQPTLKQISKRWDTEAMDEKDYAAKQVVGRDLLEQFAEAMKAAERASTTALAPRGQRAIAMGRDKWAPIATVDENARAYSWLNWGLPERCERVAAQLKTRATLMGAFLRDNSDAAVQASAVRTVGERPAEDRSIVTASTSVSTPAIAAEPEPEAPVVAPAPKPAAAPAKPAAKPAAKHATKKPAATPAPKPAATASTTGMRGSIRAD